MAESSSFDPLFTLDVVREFMLANGGKVSNHTLVTHFKSFLNDSQRKNSNRQMFKQYVNTLAVVKLDVSGEKLLVLKKKFRDSGSFRAEPAAAKFLPFDRDPVKAKRVKKDDEDPNRPSDVAAVQPTSDSSGDEPAGLKTTTTSTGSDVSAAGDKTEEEFETSADDLPSEINAESERLFESDDFKQASDSANGTYADDASAEITSVDDAVDGDVSARNADEKHAANSAVDVTPKQEPATADAALSVREMAKQLNKVDSPAAVTPHAQTTPYTSAKTKRDRESRRAEDGSSYDFSLNEAEREWTIKSAYSDYQAMAKLLTANPVLAARRDFLSGYTALHWAAKNGNEDVVKLLFGSSELPNVDARSHGGYTPLHVATIHGRDGVIRLLVEVYGANPNVRDYSGRKPKHYFAHSAVSARVQQLLQPPPPGSAKHGRLGRTAHLGSPAVGNFGGGNSAGTSPSPGSSPVAGSRQKASSVHSDDSGLMPPPRELPPVVRRRPVIASSSSADSVLAARDGGGQSHSDSEMHRSVSSDSEALRGSGSALNFSAFV